MTWAEILHTVCTAASAEMKDAHILTALIERAIELAERSTDRKTELPNKGAAKLAFAVAELHKGVDVFNKFNPPETPLVLSDDETLAKQMSTIVDLTNALDTASQAMGESVAPAFAHGR